MPNNTQHPVFAKWVRKHIKGETILDLGCGNKWYHRFIDSDIIIGVDCCLSFKPDLLIDIGKKELPFKNECFDVVLMFDVIEHMSKKEGSFALSEAKRVCKSKLYLLTPIIWDSNEKPYNDPNSEYYKKESALHKSLWKVSNFKGFKRISSVFDRDEYFFGVWWA